MNEISTANTIVGTTFPWVIVGISLKNHTPYYDVNFREVSSGISSKILELTLFFILSLFWRDFIKILWVYSDKNFHRDLTYFVVVLGKYKSAHKMIYLFKKPYFAGLNLNLRPHLNIRSVLASFMVFCIQLEFVSLLFYVMCWSCLSNFKF